MEVWEVKLKISAHLSNQNEQLYDKVTRLEEDLEDVKDTVNEIARTNRKRPNTST